MILTFCTYYSSMFSCLSKLMLIFFRKGLEKGKDWKASGDSFECVLSGKQAQIRWFEVFSSE